MVLACVLTRACPSHAGADLMELTEDELKDGLGVSKMMARKLKANLPGSRAAAAPPMASGGATTVVVIGTPAEPISSSSQQPALTAQPPYPPPPTYFYPVYQPAPAPAAPPKRGMGTAGSLMTGILVGEMMGGGRRRTNTVVVTGGGRRRW